MRGDECLIVSPHAISLFFFSRFSKLQLSVICSFLNRFCFYWYWNGIADQAQPLSASPSNASSGSSATHNYNIITPAKRLLALLYDRNCRRSFSTDDQAWLVVSEVKSRRFVELILSGSSGEASTSADRDRALIILQNMPQTVPFKSRVEIFRYFIREDRAAVESERIGAQITIKRSHVLEDGFRQLVSS